MLVLVHIDWTLAHFVYWPRMLAHVQFSSWSATQRWILDPASLGTPFIRLDVYTFDNFPARGVQSYDFVQ